MTPIYLDYAAATPVDEAALSVARPYFSDQFYNPSAVYEVAREVRKNIDKARATVADVLGCKDQEVLFTAGGTEANNMAIHGVMSQFPGKNCIVSAIEHESVLAPASTCNPLVAPVNKHGMVDLTQIETLIDDRTVLISVMYANNEVGTIQPIKQLTGLVKRIRTQRLATGNKLPLYVHTDACQAGNYLDLHVSRLGVDLMTVNGGKLYSFKQSGALYVRTGVELTPLIVGGGQESSKRSGTENVASIVAFATMLQKVQTERHEQSHSQSVKRDALYATLSQKIPGITRNGFVKHCLPNLLNFTIPHADGERLIMELDQAGVLVATGSACSASSEEPSHVLLAMGLSEDEASASVRISIGRATSDVDIARSAEVISGVVAKHQRLVQ